MTFNLTEFKVQFLQGLADKTRLRIIEALREREKTVTQLVNELGASQSNISGHLKTLKESGILKCRQEGKYVFYSLRNENIGEFLMYLETILFNLRMEALEGA